MYPAKANVIRILTIFTALIATSAVFAAKWDSPRKNDDRDISIIVKPKKGDSFSFVMRQLPVPGKEFWVSTQRSFVFGEDGDSSPFERPVPVSPNGGVQDNSGWLIWMGKYETTVGQFASVMGDGDIEKGLKVYAEYSQRGPKFLTETMSSDTAMLSALAKPADKLAPVYVQMFIRKLNILCQSNKKCRNSLPKIKTNTTIKGEMYLPFFRLPSELEWEYAARGVFDQRSKYRSRLPVSSGKIGNYAQLKKISPIAKKKDIYGFYDMFGNVSELVEGRMSESIGGTRTGAWLARGGKAGATSKKPYSSQREEILEYEWREDDKEPRTGFFNKVGFRLALGMPMQALDKMAKNERPPAGPISTTTTPAGAGAAFQATTEIAKTLAKLDSGTGLSTVEIKAMSKTVKSALERLHVAVAEQDARTARFVADNIFTKLVRIWTLEFEIYKLKGNIQKLKPTNEKRKKKIKLWTQQIDLNTDQLIHLMQEYEEGLRVLAEIDIVDGAIVDTIDMSGYQQSENQVLIALESRKLLAKHINTIKNGKILKVRKDVDDNYPFPK